jgi:hypothetical protein
MSFLSTFSVIVSTDFIGNSATNGGGAVGLYLANYGLSLVRLRFVNNSAVISGGGMSLASSNYACQISECYFYNNAADTGAGMYIGAYNGQGLLASNNQILVNATYFNSNVATEGAGVLVNNENIVAFSHVSFVDNIVTSLGAALSVNTNNVVNISNSIMTNNSIASGGIGGGALSSLASNIISVFSSTFTKNSAIGGTGGAMLLQGSSKLTIVGVNNFLNNSAAIGGAIYGKLIPLWSSSNGTLILVGNEALVGSAISLTQFEDSETTLSNITMISNTATIAGTFFWLCKGTVSSNISSCKEPKHNRLQFIDNSAPYGKTFATQPIYIRTSTQYNVTEYNSPLQPPISLGLYDYYGQNAISDTLTSTTVDVINSNCDNYIGTVSGGTTVVAGQGVVTFADIFTSCNPGGNLTVRYTSQQSNYFSDFISDSEYNFKTTSVWVFRSCHNGEKFLNGACVSCNNGTYSLIYSEDQPCMKCPEEATECYANNINIAPGYWRVSETSNTIISCPYLGCKGGYGIYDLITIHITSLVTIILRCW